MDNEGVSNPRELADKRPASILPTEMYIRVNPSPHPQYEGEPEEIYIAITKDLPVLKEASTSEKPLKAVVNASSAGCSDSRRSVKRTRRHRPISGVAMKSSSSSDLSDGEDYALSFLTERKRKLVSRSDSIQRELEWRWSTDTTSLASQLFNEDRDARFHIGYSNGTAAVKGNRVFHDTRQYFWEIKMMMPVYGTDVMIGVGTESMNFVTFRNKFCSMLGYSNESWGYSYHSRMQHSGIFTDIKNAKFGQGSIIGVHLDMWNGTLSYFNNRKPLGIMFRGLRNKKLIPMASSTAARSGLRIIKATSFPTSLQFLCCQAMRKSIPKHMKVTDALNIPPGLKLFLENNLGWLLRPEEIQNNRTTRFSGSDG